MTKTNTTGKKTKQMQKTRKARTSQARSGQLKKVGFGDAPINEDLVKMLQTATTSQRGILGLVDVFRGMHYIYENVWTEIRSVLHAHFSDHVTVRIMRDGGHTFLQYDKPHDFLPNDHTAILLDAVRPFSHDQEYPTWAICSGCGRPFRCKTTSQTIMILTPCPNLLQGTGVRLVTEALQLKNVGW